jgi:hypothetical protein
MAKRKVGKVGRSRTESYSKSESPSPVVIARSAPQEQTCASQGGHGGHTDLANRNRGSRQVSNLRQNVSGWNLLCPFDVPTDGEGVPSACFPLRREILDRIPVFGKHNRCLLCPFGFRSCEMIVGIGKGVGGDERLELRQRLRRRSAVMAFNVRGL